MKLIFKNLKFVTEHGKIVSSKTIFKFFPFLSRSIFRKVYLNRNKKIVKIYNGSISCSMKQLLLFKDISLYNGKIFKKMKLRSLFVFKKYGTLIFTRVINSGKILHITKKNSKQK
jgi:hypothetical protein